MMFDDDAPNKPAHTVSRNLDYLSVHELEEYIIDLQNEIERVKADITKKKRVFNAAESFFK